TFCPVAFTCAGSVESSTCNAGNPAMWPKVLDKTSGQRLEPPMPSRRTLVKFSFFISWLNFCRFCRLVCCCATTSSHPSQLASSLFVHNEASCCHRRRTLSAARQVSTCWLTAAANESGSLYDCPSILAVHF